MTEVSGKTRTLGEWMAKLELFNLQNFSEVVFEFLKEHDLWEI